MYLTHTFAKYFILKIVRHWPLFFSSVHFYFFYGIFESPLFIVISKCYALTSLAYDLYMTICNLFLSTLAIVSKLFLNPSLSTDIMKFSFAMAHTGCMLRLTFCDENNINHYFCEITQDGLFKFYLFACKCHDVIMSFFLIAE